MLAAVCFDLDDTLYAQRQWLAGALTAVADRAAQDGVDPVRLRGALDRIAALGSDRGRIIDDALALVGAAGVPVAPLVRAFRSYAPARLDPYPGVAAALGDLEGRVALGLVSDGDPAIQRAKLAALGLAGCFDVVVWSDEHGRAHRKPDPLPFRLALSELGVTPDDAVYVGDRPAKDVAGPVALGMRAVRVRTGEWSGQPDDERAWASVADVPAAVALLEAELAAPVPAALSY